MTIKVIAIDFGGVYFTWDSDRFAKELSAKVNVTHTKAKEAAIKDIHLLVLGKITETQYWHTFCEIIGKDVDHDILKKVTMDHFKPIKPVVTLMSSLRKKYKIALVTNQHSMLDDLDKKYDFYRNFDLVVCSHILKAAKPQKKIYQEVLKKLKVEAEEVIFIDDMQKNVDGAKELGMDGIHFKNITQLKADLAKRNILSS